MRLEEIEEEEELQVSEGRDLVGSMVGRRRVAITWAVGEAWETFSREKGEVVQNSFRVVGLSLPIDGSEDSKLSIKGLANDLLVEGLKEVDERNDTSPEELEVADGEIDGSEEEVNSDCAEEINFIYE